MNRALQRTRLVCAGAAAAALLAGLAGCAPESEPEPTPTAAPSPTPTPTPTPEPQPGDGPECPTDHCVSVAMTGDLLFHESLWAPFAISENDDGENFDFVPLLEGQKQYLERADLAICQMETPLAPAGGPYAAYPMFSIPPEVAVAAQAVGYDACTTASNHSVDEGTDGLVRTLDALEAAGLEHTGTYREEGERDEPLILEANGVQVAIITSTFSLNGLNAETDWQVDFPLEPDRAIEKAQRAREEGAEIVLYGGHVGTEYSVQPDQQQIDHNRLLADSGEFDFVYNHHSHSVLPAELYNDVWIAYGLGNTISESAPPERRVNNEFLMLRVQFAQNDDESWEVNDLAWNLATNMQDGGYKWCSVGSDAPQGVCQGEDFDTEVRERNRATFESMGAADDGAREWLITEE